MIIGRAIAVPALLLLRPNFRPLSLLLCAYAND